MADDRNWRHPPDCVLLAVRRFGGRHVAPLSKYEFVHGVEHNI